VVSTSPKAIEKSRRCTLSLYIAPYIGALLLGGVRAGGSVH